MEQKLGRRGFLGLFTKAAVAVAVAPIIIPKKSFFSFFVPDPPKIIVPTSQIITVGYMDSISEAIAKIPNGGTILVKAGTYIINQSILLPANVTIVGENLTIRSCDITAKESRNDPMITFTGSGNMIDNCFMKGSGPGAMISFDASDDSDDNIIFTGSTLG